MRIGLAQINSVLGDFETNRIKILDFVHKALDKECDLVVFPESSLMGYLPGDLLERPSVVEAQLREFERLQKEIPDGIAVLIGLMSRNTRKQGKPFHNSAALMLKGKKPRLFHKELLPTYDVFDEARHIEKGKTADNIFSYKKHRFLVTICEDIWGWDLPGYPTNYMKNPLLALKGSQVDVVLNLSASPFTHVKAKYRKEVVTKTAKHFKAPMVYVNMVGAQDELIFDGGSFGVDARGKTLAQSIYFEEDLNIVDLSNGQGGFREAPRKPVERTRQALVLGLRDYVYKSGFKSVHLGLSGGIDSAVAACLAVDALGPARVTGITLPGPFSEERSRTLAEALAKNLDIRCLNMPIGDGYDALLKTLTQGLGDFEFGLVNENLQARIRGVLLMAYSNLEGSMLITTGNKSEYATGYSTLYGDMCGGLAPLADLTKGEVYELAEHYNFQRELIPLEIITRPPTAELRHGQKDQDSLPPYPELDASVKRLVEQRKPARSNTDKWLLNLLLNTEFKRWQAPPILKVSTHSFGRGRRLPIAHKAKT